MNHYALTLQATLREAGLNDIVLVGGRYGLGSNSPSSVFAVYKELEKDALRTVSQLVSEDDVTHLSLPEVKPALITSASWYKQCKFWGAKVGDGTVVQTRTLTKIISDHTDKYIRAYFQYDSKDWWCYNFSLEIW